MGNERRVGEGASGFSWRRRIASFGPARRGVALVVRTQHNAWIHLTAAATVIVAGAWLDVTRSEWGLLILAMALVVSAEAFNTAVEALGDAVSPGRHALVGQAKDVAAGAVLLAAAGALAVGLLIFGPRLVRLWPGGR